MKIRNYMIVSYIVFLAIILSALYWASNVYLARMTDAFDSAARGLSRQIVQVNRDLSRTVLTEYGEDILEARTEALAHQMALQLSKAKGRGDIRSWNYDELKKWDGLKDVLTRPVVVLGDTIGYTVVIHRGGMPLYHPNPKAEGKHIDTWRESFPDMWQILRESLKKEHVRGRYKFPDNEGTIRDKYMVCRQIPDTPLILNTTVFTDRFFLPVHKQIDQAAQRENAASARELDGIRERFSSSLRVNGGFLVLIMLVVGIVLAIVFARGLSRPIVRIGHQIELMSDGDFTTSVDEAGPYELRTLAVSINNLALHLGSLLRQVKQSGIQVMSVATQIASTSAQQEHSVNQFGASTNQVVASAREITATSRELARTMDAVAGFAGHTRTVADEGAVSLRRMGTTMEGLSSSTDSVSETLRAISETAGQIGSIVTTMTKVADQTNLLSLNAAIEAEKAGEYGLGFNVVAREIRRLADQTAVAALEIETIVSGMRESVGRGVREMESFTGRVREAVTETEANTVRIEGILEQVRTLTPKLDEVNQGMQAQSEGARQITQAMVQLNENALATSEAVQSFQKVTRALKDAARALQKETTWFRVEES